MPPRAASAVALAAIVVVAAAGGGARPLGVGSGGRRLSASTAARALGAKDAIPLGRQLITIEEGKLVLSNDFKDEIEAVKGPLLLLVFFGMFKTGKSTIATLLSCAISDTPVHFPSEVALQTHGQGMNTEGLWASHPFVSGKNTYMILDMQGLDQLANGRDKYDVKMMHHALVKMLAMLSEVASVFVQVSAETYGVSDVTMLGHALKDTREHMIAASEEGGAASKMPSVRSDNHAALYVITRAIVSEATMEDKQVQEDALYHFKDIDKDFQPLLAANFVSFTTDGTPIEPNHAKSETCPWVFHRLPKMDVRAHHAPDGRMVRDQTYYWTSQQPFQHGEGCAVLTNMSLDIWNFEQSPVPVFKRQLELLAEKIPKIAPQREISWGGGKAQPVTGEMVWQFLEFGVKQMNLLGPLPDDELWRTIMTNGCESQVKTLLDKHLGFGANGALRELQEDLKAADNKDAGQVIKNAENKWEAKIIEAYKILKYHFDKSLNAVRESCEDSAYKYIKRLQDQYETMLARGDMQRWKAAAAHYEKELDKTIFENNKIFFTIWAVVGCVLFLVMMRMFRQTCRMFQQTCLTFRELCGCCGDCFSFKQESRTVVRRAGDGTEMGERIVYVQQGGGSADPAHSASSPAPQVCAQTSGGVSREEALLQQMQALESQPQQTSDGAKRY